MCGNEPQTARRSKRQVLFVDSSPASFFGTIPDFPLKKNHASFISLYNDFPADVTESQRCAWHGPQGLYHSLWKDGIGKAGSQSQIHNRKHLIWIELEQSTYELLQKQDRQAHQKKPLRIGRIPPLLVYRNDNPEKILQTKMGTIPRPEPKHQSIATSSSGSFRLKSVHAETFGLYQKIRSILWIPSNTGRRLRPFSEAFLIPPVYW